VRRDKLSPLLRTHYPALKIEAAYIYPEKWCLPKYTALRYERSAQEVNKCFTKAGCTFCANDASTKGEKYILKGEI